MAGRFPGASSIEAFWENLTAGRETLTTIGASDLPPEENAADPDYVPRRGLIGQPDWFDAGFFNIPPNEAAVMDPQQRVFLETAWHALEHAGCDPAQFPGLIGVYAGMSNNSWLHHQILPNPELRTAFGYEANITANEKDYLATRTAYKLNLRGPALNIYTACSTSLVAVCQAVQSLMAHACDAALAGGVSIKWPQERGYVAYEGSLYSPDGHCRPYDAAARGTVFSNGVGVVVLKRLEDALRDGDSIYAVIKGAAVNNDGGEKATFMAPSVHGHSEVIALAHAMADVHPSTISYVEGHGTATPLGDPIEVAGLTAAFRAGTSLKGFCGLGSVKSNIGHMDAAAGIGGLIKTALALHHRQLPPTLHFQHPNPALQLEDSPFYIVSKNQPWISNHPLRAGVSSFGVGGTNAHVVMEEAPAIKPSTPADGPQLIVVSAKTETALTTSCRQLAKWLETSPSPLADAAWTLQTGRQAFAFRRAIAVRDRNEAITGLREPLPTPLPEIQPLPVVFLFPGQGASSHSELPQTYAAAPAFRLAYDECLQAFRTCGLPDLRTLDARDLENTAFAQPAQFALSYALGRLLMSWGIKPAAMCGHSLGEYTAVTLAGVFSLADAARIITARAKLMAATAPGAMLAVRLPEAETLPLLPEQVDIAACNSPHLTIVSGTPEVIARLREKLTQSGTACRLLPVRHAFHSAAMDPVLGAFREVFAGVQFHPPSIPCLSNLSGKFLTDQEAMDPAYYVRHLRETVRFSGNLDTLGQSGVFHFIEAGTGRALTTTVRQHPLAKAGSAVSLTGGPGDEKSGDWQQALEALGSLWQSGVTVDWAAVHAPARRLRVALPGYPFERKRYHPGTRLPAGTRREGEAWLLPPDGNGDVFRQSPTLSDDGTEAALNKKIHEENVPAIQEKLVRLLHGVSGIDVGSADPRTSLLDLGFDSLLLTSASLNLTKEFGLKIPLRRLMDDLGSVDSLVRWLKSQLPQDPAQHGAGPAESSMPSAPVAAAPPVPAGIQPHRIGPFQPLPAASSAGIPLTEDQRRHLDDLIEAINAKFPQAKQFTADHREVLADPRAVAGWHPLWKEMTFPAVSVRSAGAFFWDTDGNRWIDVVQGFGSGLFGHRPDFVTDALHAQIDAGFEIGPTSPLAGEVAWLIREFSGQERTAFCNTGSEAVLAAIRTARTFSGRDLIVMFSGAYHGVFDEVLARPLTQNGERRTIPVAPGIPESSQANILVLEWDDPESLEILRRHGAAVACVLVEPVQSRRPDVVPVQFLKSLRDLTTEFGMALVFDEVVLGFRTAPGGAQEFFGIWADLVVYGKTAGGGLPLGILCGRREYMDTLDGGAWTFGDDSRPETGVTFFAGTFIRHPLALAAARAVLLELKAEGPGLQENLNAVTLDFSNRLNAIFAAQDAPFRCDCFSSLWMIRATTDSPAFPLLFHHLRLRGIHLANGRPGFLSTAHSAETVSEILIAFSESTAALREAGFFPGAGQLGHGDAAPATPAQQEIFLASRLHGEQSASFTESVSIQLSGPVEDTLLTKALQLLVDRHDSFRATVNPEGETLRFAPHATACFSEDPVVCVSPDVLQGARQEEAGRVFDPTRGPLHHFRLIRTGPASAELILTAHHLVLDGWSFGLLVHEFPMAWQAAVQGSTLPAAPRFEEYVREQHQARCRGEFRGDLSWWLEQYADLPGRLQLPCDGVRPPHPGMEADLAEAVVPAETVRKLKAFSSRHQCTLHQTLLAAWQILLHRLTGRTDFVIGLPVAGQPAAGLPEMTGHCVQFLPLRVKPDPMESALTLLHRTRLLTLSAMDHQRVTLGEILNHLPHLPATERRGFVSNTFSFERTSAPFSIGPLTGSATANPKTRTSFDLSLNIFLTDHDDLILRCGFLQTLFGKPAIARWLTHYLTLLNALLEQPEQEIRRLPMLDSLQRSQLLNGFNDSRQHFPDAPCLHHWFQKTAALHAARPAVSCDGKVLTYAGLNTCANQLAHWLISHGAGPGTVTALRLGRSVHYPAMILAVLKTGGAWLPIDPLYPAPRQDHLLKDSGASLLVHDSENADGYPDFDGAVLHLAEALQALAGFSDQDPAASVTPDATAHLIYTSGSTGTPKGCPVTHRNVSRLMLSTQPLFDFGPGDAWTLFHSFNFDFSVWEMWGALLYGGRVVIVPHSTARDPDAFLHLLIREKVTVLNQTPGAFFQLMLADQAGPGLLPASLRYILFGGEALPMAGLAGWFGRHGDAGPQLFNLYGITETTVHVTCRRVLARDVTGGSLIGLPLPDLEFYILDPETMEPQPIGVAGEIFVGGDGVIPGYLNRPELTKQKFLPNPFTGTGQLYRTGDLGRFIPDDSPQGLDVEFLGRVDQQVKIRGFRIEPGEIENALLRHPQIRGAAVAAIPGPTGDSQLCAWIASAPPDNSSEPLSPDGIRQHLLAILPEHLTPSNFILLPELPMTANGKLDRNALPAPGFDADSTSDGLTASSSGSPFERRLAILWKSVTGRSPGGASDFFASGGTSLQAFRLVLEIRREFSVHFSPGLVFENSGFRKMAAAIERAPASPAGSAGPEPTRHPSLTCLQPGTGKPPLFLIHGGDGGALFYRSLLPFHDPDQPVFVLESPALTDDAWLLWRPGVETSAAHYLTLIRQIQPRGPYQIGGYSFGGLVAWELARQLHAAGETTRPLVLFDTENPSTGARFLTLPERVAAAWSSGGPGSFRKTLHVGRRLFSGLATALNRQREDTEALRLLASGIAATGVLRTLQIRAINTEAMQKYSPLPWPGHLVLLRSTAPNDKYEFRPDYGWGPLVKSLQILDVSGNHLELFDPPHARTLASALAAGLRPASAIHPDPVTA